MDKENIIDIVTEPIFKNQKKATKKLAALSVSIELSFQ